MWIRSSTEVEMIVRRFWEISSQNISYIFIASRVRIFIIYKSYKPIKYREKSIKKTELKAEEIDWRYQGRYWNIYYCKMINSGSPCYCEIYQEYI